MARVFCHTKNVSVLIVVVLTLVIAELHRWQRMAMAQTGEVSLQVDAVPNADALSLLEEGKSLQRNSQFADANDVYVSVLETYPGAPEAAQTLVELARVVPYLNDKECAERFWQLAATVYADSELAAEAVKTAADEYRSRKKYVLAREMYQRLVDTWPDALLAPQALEGVASCSLCLGQDAAAHVAADRLFSEYGTLANAGEAAYSIVLAYGNAGQQKDGEILAADILSAWPSKEGMVWGQVAMAAVALRQNRMEEGQARVTELLNEWPREGEWAQATYRLGRVCRHWKHYEMSYTLCKEASKHMTKVPLVLARDVVLAQIGRGNIAAAQDGVDRLVVDYADNERLPWRLNEIAAGYQNGRHAAQAKGILQYIVNTWPEPRNGVMDALTELARYDIQEGHYEAAKQATDRVITEYGSNRWLPVQLLAIAQKYQGQGKADYAIPLYEHVAATWPKRKNDCMNALMGLGICHVYAGDLEKAHDVLERLQEQYGYSRVVNRKMLEIARVHRRAGWVDEAMEIYTTIEQQTSDLNDHVLEAVHEMSLCYIDKNQPEAAKEVLDRIEKDFAGNRWLPSKFLRTAGAYREAGQWDRAIETYQHLCQAWPAADSNLQVLAQEGIAVCQIYGDNKALAQASKDQIIEKFGNHPLLSGALMHIAHVHREKGNLPEAMSLYQYVEENWPDNDDRILWSRYGQFASYLARGEVASAEPLCASIKQEFANSSHSSAMHAEIAAAYQYRGAVLAGEGDQQQAEEYLALAIEEAQQAVAEASTALRLAEAHFILGNAYHYSGRPAEAIEAFQAALEHMPRHQYAWHMWYVIGQNTRQLKAEGLLSEEQADRDTKIAYQTLVKVFPRCPAAAAAQAWLAENSQ